MTDPPSSERKTKDTYRDRAAQLMPESLIVSARELAKMIRKRFHIPITAKDAKVAQNRLHREFDQLMGGEPPVAARSHAEQHRRGNLRGKSRDIRINGA